MAIPESHNETAAGESAVSRASYRDFSFVVGAWFGCWGMQGVLFSWLIVGELGSTAEMVGVAQFALVLPGLVFLLLAGATADRGDRRRQLLYLHGFAGAAVTLLALSVGLGWLSLPLLFGYALVMGSLSAFLSPTRDSMLSDVAGSSMLRSVIGVTLTQFGAQASGAFLAGAAAFVGSEAMLCLQAAIVLAGMLAIRRLPRSGRVVSATRERLQLAEILAGLREVLASRALLPVFLLTLGVGFFFQGPFFVVYPLLVRDYYQGGIELLGPLTASFHVGAVLGSLYLLRRGSVRRRGLAMSGAQSIAALCLLTIALGVPYPVALLAGLGWGLAGAVFLNIGRTVFQERASEINRARVLSVYSLGFYAAGAIGSPAAGLMAGALGPLGAFAVCGSAMLVFVAGTALLTDLLRVR